MPTTLSSFYTVSINYIAGTGDSDGFIDNLKVEQYMAQANGATAPASLTTSTNKVRANIRHKTIMEQLQLMGNMYDHDDLAVGATIDTPGTAFNFVLEVERGDEVLATQDELNPGVELYGANAVVRCIARSLMEGRANYNYAVFNPTPSTAPSNGGQTTAIARQGSTTITFNVGPLTTNLSDGANAVTVTKFGNCI